MKELKTLSDQETDLIKAKVGGSSLYLKAITHHEVFNPITEKLKGVVGNKYDLEIRNLVACIVSSIKKLDTGLSYSRDKNIYSGFNKSVKNRKKASYTKLFYVIDKLSQLGYIESYKGYKDVEGGYSMSSCIIYKDKLIELFNLEDVDKYGEAIQDELVVVRDSDGNNKSGFQTEELEAQVKGLNEWLGGHSFKFGVFEKKVWLKRVFNEDLNTGGRLFFGFLQTIEATKRPSFLIRNSRVSDLDFSSMHYSLIATLENVNLPENFKPYDIDISDLVTLSGNKDNKSRYRNIVKLACLLLINSGNPSLSLRNAWKQNIKAMDKYKEEGNYGKFESNTFYGASGLDNCNLIIERLVKHNQYAAPYFHKKGGCWGQMQKLESDILMDILLELKTRDLPVLPYHDGLLCESHRSNEVITVMENSWFRVLGNIQNCKIERKY